MIVREGEIIESGRRWMAGEASSDEYFSKVLQSAPIAPGRELVRSIRAWMLAVLRSRRTS
ncbi:hypothetical protein ACFZB6_19760 [Streptomyces syringium]|uniref:hypothetical protein n=1 Tax=Streptomyces TaxID=1883 RepID=UPI00339F2818